MIVIGILFSETIFSLTLDSLVFISMAANNIN